MSEVYMIGNAHLDPVWLWRWQDGFSEILATYRSALDRLYEFLETKFTSACAVYCQWIEKMAPDMFAEIQEIVKQGRWEIIGGWFLQPDCNIPSGESFMRHTLISQRYFKEKFGVTATTGYNVDSFGHNAGLPKILRSGGMENYVFMRPSLTEQGIREFTYSLYPACGNSENERKAAQLNFGLRRVMGSFHKGSLPETSSCISCDCANVIISAIKQSEDGDGMVLRLYEIGGKDTTAQITWFDKKIFVSVPRNSLKTVNEDGDALDAMEWEMEK